MPERTIMRPSEKTVEKEVFKAIVYECNFKDFSKDVTKDGTPIHDWSEALWHLLNAKNTYNAVLKLDVLQRGKDENGFYQNYVYLLVEEDSDIDWDGYLKYLGYGFSKSEVNLCRYILEYDEKIDDYLLEVV